MLSNYIKSPFNYIGGKFKLLSEIIPLFPRNIETFHDIFGGGFNVGLNANANKVVYNDIIPYVLEVFRELKNISIDTALNEVYKIINTYELTMTNEQGFKKLREDYNNEFKTWASFYVLTCYSFNYQYRFNNSHEYNSSFGRNRSSFTKVSEKKLIEFMDRLHSINIEFYNKNFKEFDYDSITSNDFVYFDPPYLITTGNYNDGKRGFEGWSIEDEYRLYDICDELHNRGIKFLVNNVTHHKGEVNQILLDWSNKYEVVELHSGFAKSYNSKNDGITREIAIKNY